MVKKILLLFTSFFVVTSYSQEDCQDAMSSIIENSINLSKEIRDNLHSNQVSQRLEALEEVKNMGLSWEATRSDISPLIYDSSPQVRIAVVRVMQDQNPVHIAPILLLKNQFIIETDESVSKAIMKAVMDLEKRQLIEIRYEGEKILLHIKDLDFSIQKAFSLLQQMNIDGEKWTQMSAVALKKSADQRTALENLFVAVHEDVSKHTDDFQNMIQTLPFLTAKEFFSFLSDYLVIKHHGLRVHRQTYLIIHKVYQSKPNATNG